MKREPNPQVDSQSPYKGNDNIVKGIKKLPHFGKGDRIIFRSICLKGGSVF